MKFLFGIAAIALLMNCSPKKEGPRDDFSMDDAASRRRNSSVDADRSGREFEKDKLAYIRSVEKELNVIEANVARERVTSGKKPAVQRKFIRDEADRIDVEIVETRDQIADVRRANAEEFEKLKGKIDRKLSSIHGSYDNLRLSH